MPISVVSNAPRVGSRVIAIRKLSVEAPFDSPSLVYRTGEFAYERDPYAGFLASPAESFLAPVREFLRGQGSFQALAEPGSALQANLLLEISVDQLYGDFRNPGEPAAVFGVRFVFFEAPNGVPGKVLFAHSYLQRNPIQARSPAALVEGWDRGLHQVLTNVVADFNLASDPSKGDEALRVSSGNSDPATPNFKVKPRAER